MEIIKTYNTRRSTRGTPNPPPPPAAAVSAPDGPNADSSATAANSDGGAASSPSSSATTAASPAIPSPLPAAAVVISASKIVTRRSTGRLQTRSALLAAANTNSPTQSSKTTLPISSSSAGVDKKAEDTPISAKEDTEDVEMIAEVPPSAVTSQPSVRSTRSRRGSSSSSSSNATTTSTATSNISAVLTRSRRSGRAAAAQLQQAGATQAKQQNNNNNANDNQRAGANSEKNGTSNICSNANVATTAELKENGNSENCNEESKIATGIEALALENSSSTSAEVTAEQATAPSSTSIGTPSAQLLEIEKSILAKEGLFKANSKGDERGGEKEEEVPSLPNIVLVDGATGLPFQSSAAGYSGRESSPSEDNSSSTGEDSPKPLSTIHLTVSDDGRIYVNPITPDTPVPANEDGETFAVQLPKSKVSSSSNPLPGVPTAPTTGRSRKTKPQAVTYGGDSSVGFLDPSVGSQMMELGQQLHRGRSQLLRQGLASTSEPSIVMTLETHRGGDVTSSSAIVSLEVPTGSIDPNDFENHLDPQSIAALENVLQSDQGREILTEALGGMGVVTVTDSSSSGWDHHHHHSYNTGGREESIVSSSGVLSTPIDSPSSTTAVLSRDSSIAGTPANQQGPAGRRPGRPFSTGAGRQGGGARQSVTPTPMSRKISESDSANIRRSQRQQDKFERQEAERIREENQLMLQREKEQMKAASQQAQQASASPSPTNIPPTMAPHAVEPVNVGIVSSTQITPVHSSGPSTPIAIPVDKSGIDSTTERGEGGGGNGNGGRRPTRTRKLPAHLADPNYLSMEEAASAVKEATRRVSTSQQEFVSGEESNVGSPAAKPVQEISRPPSVKEEPLQQQPEDEQEGTEEEEEDYTDDDPNKLWCICRQPHNNRFMICCDICEDWFHGKCVNITKAKGQIMELNNVAWHCPTCKGKSKGAGQKQKQKQEKATAASPPPPAPKQPAVARGRKSSSAHQLQQPTPPPKAKESPPTKGKETPVPPIIKGKESHPAPTKAKESSQTPAKGKESSPMKGKESAPSTARSSRPTPKMIAQKAEVDAAAVAAVSAEPPSKIAAAAAGRRGRNSEKVDLTEEPATPGSKCMICKKPARSGSAYCSDLCVQKYAENVGNLKGSPTKEKAASPPSNVPASPVTSESVPAATTPTSSKSPGSAQSKFKRSHSLKEPATDPIFNFHVINPSTGVSTEVVPPKPKELTASQLLKAQKEKAQQEKASAVQQTTPTGSVPKTPTTSSSQSPLPTVPGISPNSVSAIVNSGPNVVIKKIEDGSSKGMIINASSASASDPSAQEQDDDPVSCSEKTERTRTSSISTTDSAKSHRSSSSSSTSKSVTPSSKEKLERRDPQKVEPQQSKMDGPSSEKLHRESMRKTFKEALKKRSEKLNSSDKKKMGTAGITPDSVSVQIEEELVNCFGSANNPKCKNKYRSIWFNIKDEKNSLFREIMVGNVKPYDLVRMTADQMAPSELAQWRKQEEEKGLEAIKRAELDKLAEAKKQELIGKGVEDAVQVAEETKPRDISDIIIDPESEKKKDHKSKEGRSSSSHHHRDKDKRSHRNRDKPKEKERELRSRDRDRDHKSSRDKDKDRDKHRHTDKDSEKDKKEKERHRSSSCSGHKSSHHDKDKEKDRRDREKERRSDRQKEKEKDKVKHDKDKESRSGRDRSSKHAKDSDKEKDRSREKESSESPKSVSSEKEEKEKEKTVEKVESTPVVKVEAEEESQTLVGSPTTVTTSSSDTTTPSPFIATTTASSTTAKEADIKPMVTDDARHASIDSEQELPSSTIKTPDFAEDSSSAAGGKKEGLQESLFQATLEMPDLGSFKASFYNVSHNENTLKGPYFPESPVPVVGRISHETAWEYIEKIKKTKEIVTFRMVPATLADAKGYMTYFTYLSSRGRLGVIGGLRPPLKDVYLLPLEKHQPIPSILQPFAGPGLPKERSHCLLAIVTRHVVSGGLKRKLSSVGAENSKKKTKIGGDRVLRNSSVKVESESQAATPPETAADKQDDLKTANAPESKPLKAGRNQPIAAE